MQQTKRNQVVGTPNYMSPEQALGQDLDHRTDIFSFGVVLYELATGQKQFDGKNFAEIIDKIVHAQPTAIGRLNYDVPHELERIALKCLQKSPDRRYQSARELMIDLQNLVRDLESGANVGRTDNWPAVGERRGRANDERRVVRSPRRCGGCGSASTLTKRRGDHLCECRWKRCQVSLR